MSNNEMFTAKEICPRTWQITYSFTKLGRDKGGMDPVFCYLLEGDTYALVIDTMYGYCNLRAFC